MTVLEVLQTTTAYFTKRGIEHPRQNAEQLIAHSLGKKRLDIYLEFERNLDEAQLGRLRELVRRRGQREPLQHLLGTVEFCGSLFLCDKRALVPRPETEQLVELLLHEIQNPRPRIADIGTGSGVIAFSLAAKLPEAEIIGTDVSAEALALARENAARCRMPAVQFIQTDLLQDVDGAFDVIVANLPYVSRHDREQLAPEVLHDPEISLFAGERGDEVVRRLIEIAPAHLRTGGLLALEIGLGQADGLSQLLHAKNYRDVDTKNDYSGVNRFIFARYG